MRISDWSSDVCSSDLGGHCLRHGELADAGVAVQATEAAGAHTAEGQAGEEGGGECVVDADRACGAPLDHVEAHSTVAPEHAHSQPIVTVVPNPHRVIDIVHGDDGDHDPEGLFPGKGHVRPYVIHDTWLEAAG